MVEIRKIDENRLCFPGGCDPTQLIIYSNIPKNICRFQLFGCDEMDATSQIALKHVFFDSPLSSLKSQLYTVSQLYIPIIYPNYISHYVPIISPLSIESNDLPIMVKDPRGQA